LRCLQHTNRSTIVKPRAPGKVSAEELQYIGDAVVSYVAISHVNGDPCREKAKDVYAILEDLMKLRKKGKCRVPTLWKQIKEDNAAMFEFC